MDEQTSHVDGELEIDTTGDDAADTASSDTKEQGTDSEDKQEGDALDLGEEKPKEKSKAETVRDQQVEAWTAKITSGEKSLEDLPANLKWLKPLVEEKLGTKAPDIKETVASAIKEEREAAKLETLLEDLKELPKEKKVKLNEKIKHFRSKGLSKLDAVETAMEALNINPEEDRIDARRQAARLRTPGRYKTPGKDTSIGEVETEAGYAEVYKRFPAEKRLEYLKALRGMR